MNVVNIEKYPSARKVTESLGDLKESVEGLAQEVGVNALEVAEIATQKTMDMTKEGFSALGREAKTIFGAYVDYTRQEPVRGAIYATVAGFLVHRLLVK